MNERLIQIKPIKFEEVEQEVVSNSLSLQDEKKNIENELQIARAELERLHQEKEKLLQSVREEISAEKEKWEQEKQVLEKEGYQEGYDLGLTEGKQVAKKQYHHLVDQVNHLVNVATIDYHKTLEQSEHMIVDLSIKTAEKIIKQKINEDPKLYLNIITAAIQEIKDQSVISIYLHPENYESIMKQKGELSNSLDGDTKLAIYIDQKMTENECLIEHPFGQIDASIDTQLQQIQNILHQVTQEKNHEH